MACNAERKLLLKGGARGWCSWWHKAAGQAYYFNPGKTRWKPRAGRAQGGCQPCPTLAQVGMYPAYEIFLWALKFTNLEFMAGGLNVNKKGT